MHYFYVVIEKFVCFLENKTFKMNSQLLLGKFRSKAMVQIVEAIEADSVIKLIVVILR